MELIRSTLTIAILSEFITIKWMGKDKMKQFKR